MSAKLVLDIDWFTILEFSFEVSWSATLTLKLSFTIEGEIAFKGILPIWNRKQLGQLLLPLGPVTIPVAFLMGLDAGVEASLKGAVGVEATGFAVTGGVKSGFKYLYGQSPYKYVKPTLTTQIFPPKFYSTATASVKVSFEPYAILSFAYVFDVMVKVEQWFELSAAFPHEACNKLSARLEAAEGTNVHILVEELALTLSLWGVTKKLAMPLPYLPARFKIVARPERKLASIGGVALPRCIGNSAVKPVKKSRRRALQEAAALLPPPSAGMPTGLGLPFALLNAGSDSAADSVLAAYRVSGDALAGEAAFADVAGIVAALARLVKNETATSAAAAVAAQPLPFVVDNADSQTNSSSSSFDADADGLDVPPAALLPCGLPGGCFLAAEPWDACDAVCGLGLRRRQVRCIAADSGAQMPLAVCAAGAAAGSLAAAKSDVNGSSSEVLSRLPPTVECCSSAPDCATEALPPAVDSHARSPVQLVPLQSSGVQATPMLHRVLSRGGSAMSGSGSDAGASPCAGVVFAVEQTTTSTASTAVCLQALAVDSAAEPRFFATTDRDAALAAAQGLPVTAVAAEDTFSLNELWRPADAAAAFPFAANSGSDGNADSGSLLQRSLSSMGLRASTQCIELPAPPSQAATAGAAATPAAAHRVYVGAVFDLDAPATSGSCTALTLFSASASPLYRMRTGESISVALGPGTAAGFPLPPHAYAQARIVLSPPAATAPTSLSVSAVGAVIVVTSPVRSNSHLTLHSVQTAAAAVDVLPLWPFDPILNTVAPLAVVGSAATWIPLGAAAAVPVSVSVLSFPHPPPGEATAHAAAALLSITMQTTATTAVNASDPTDSAAAIRVVASPVYDAAAFSGSSRRRDAEGNAAAPGRFEFAAGSSDSAAGAGLSMHIVRSPHGATTTHASFRIRAQLAAGAPASCASPLSAVPLLVGVAAGEASLQALAVFAHPSISSTLAGTDARVRPLAAEASGDDDGSVWLSGVVSAREAWFSGTLTLLVTALPPPSATGDGEEPLMSEAARCGRWLTGYWLEATMLEALPPQLRRSLSLVVDSDEAALFSLSSAVPATSAPRGPYVAPSAAASAHGSGAPGQEALCQVYPLVDALQADMLLLSVTAPTSQGGQPLNTAVKLRSPAVPTTAAVGSISGLLPAGARCRPAGATKTLTVLLPGLSPDLSVSDASCGSCSAAAPVLSLRTVTAAPDGDMHVGDASAAALPPCPVSSADADVFAQPAGNGTGSSSNRPRRPNDRAAQDDSWADTLPWWLTAEDPIAWTAVGTSTTSQAGSRRARVLQASAGVDATLQATAPPLALWDDVAQLWTPVVSSSLFAPDADEGSECALAIIAAAAGTASASAGATSSEVLQEAVTALLGADEAARPVCAVLTLPSARGLPLSIAVRVPGWSLASLALLPLAGTSVQAAAASFTMPDAASLGADSGTGSMTSARAAGVASFRSSNCGSDSRRMYARAALAPAATSEGSTATSEPGLPLRIAVLFTTAAGIDSGFSLATLAAEGRREAAAALLLSPENFTVTALRNASGPSAAFPSGCMRAAFRWAVAPWDPCDSQCGPGVQKRSVWCVDSLAGGAVDAAVCERAGLPQPLEQRTCDAGQCGFAAGAWGACTPSCGAEGERSRDWTCRNGLGAPVEPWRCSNSSLPFSASFDADDRIETAPCPRELLRPCAAAATATATTNASTVPLFYLWRPGPWTACAAARWLRSPAHSESTSSGAASEPESMGLKSRPVDCVAIPIAAGAPLLTAQQFAALPAQPERLCRLFSSSSSSSTGPRPADTRACRAHPPATAAVSVRHIPVLTMQPGSSGAAAANSAPLLRRRFSLLPEQAATLLIPVRDIVARSLARASAGASTGAAAGVCVRVAASVVPAGDTACSDVAAITALRSCGADLQLCLTHPQAVVDGNSKFVRQSDTAGNVTSVWFRGLPFDAPGAALPGTPGATPANASTVARCFAAAQRCLAQQVCDAAATASAAAAVASQCAAAIGAAHCPAPLPRSAWRSPSGAPFATPASSSLNAPSIGVFASPVDLAPSSDAVGAPLQLAPGTAFVFPASEAAATWYTWSVPSLALHQPPGSSAPRRPSFAYLPLSLSTAAALPPAFDSSLHSHAMLQVSNADGAAAGLATLVDVVAAPLRVFVPGAAPQAAPARAVLGGSLVAMAKRLGHIPDTALAAGGLTLTIDVECDEWLLPAAASDVAAGYWSSLLRMLRAEPVSEDSSTPMPQQSAPGSWAQLATPLLQRGAVPVTVSFDIPAAPGAAAIAAAAVAASDAVTGAGARSGSGSGSQPDSVLASNIDGAAADGSVPQLQQGRGKPLRYGAAAVTRITVQLPPLRGYAPASDELISFTVPSDFLASGADAIAVAVAEAEDSAARSAGSTDNAASGTAAAPPIVAAVQQLRIRSTRKACIVSPWSPWSQCAPTAAADASALGGLNSGSGATNAAGTRAGFSMRSRTVMQAPGASAPACPPLTESRTCVVLPSSTPASALPGQQELGGSSAPLAGTTATATSALGAALLLEQALRPQPSAGAAPEPARQSQAAVVVAARDAFAALRARRSSLLGSLRRDMLACLSMAVACAQGMCVAGQCICPAGFAGSDCSAPPPLQLANAPLLESPRDAPCISMTSTTTASAGMSANSLSTTVSLWASTAVATRSVSCAPAQRGSAGPTCSAGAPSGQANPHDAVGANEEGGGNSPCPFQLPAASQARARADTVSVTSVAVLRLPLATVVLAAPSLRTALALPPAGAGGAAPSGVLSILPLASAVLHAASTARSPEPQALAIDAALVQRLALWLQDAAQALFAMGSSDSSVNVALAVAVDVGNLSVRMPASAGSDHDDVAAAALRTAVEAFAPGSAVPLHLRAVVDVQLTLTAPAGAGAVAGAQREALQSALRTAAGQFLRTLACRSSKPTSAAAASAVLRRGAFGSGALAQAGTDGAAQAAAAMVEAALLCIPGEGEVTYVDLPVPAAVSTRTPGRFTQSQSQSQSTLLFTTSLPAEAVTRGPATVVATSLDPTDGVAALVDGGAEPASGGVSTADRLLRTPIGISALSALAASAVLLLIFFAAIDACIPVTHTRCCTSLLAFIRVRPAASSSSVTVANPLHALSASSLASEPAMLKLDPRARPRRLRPAVVALGASAVLLLVLFAALLGSALAADSHRPSSGRASHGAGTTVRKARRHRKAAGDGFAVPASSFHEAHAASSLAGMAASAEAADAGSFHAEPEAPAARALRHLHMDVDNHAPAGVSAATEPRGRRAAAVASIEAAAAAAAASASAPRPDAIAAHMERLNEQRVAQHAAHLDEVYAMQRAGVADADAEAAGIVPGRGAADPAGFAWASDDVGVAGGRRLFYTTTHAHDNSPEHTLRTLPPLTYVPPQRLPDSLAYDITIGDHVIHLDAGIGGEAHPLVLSVACPRSAALELRLQEAAMSAEQLYGESGEQRRARRMAAMTTAGTMRVRVLDGAADAGADAGDSEGAALMAQLLSAVDGAPFIAPSEWRVGDVLVGDHRWSCRFDAEDGGVAPFYREITSITEEASTIEVLQSSSDTSSSSRGDAGGSSTDIRVRVRVLVLGFEDVHPLSLFDEYSLRGHADPQPFSWAPAHGNGVHPVPGPVVAPLSPVERDRHAASSAGATGRLDRRLWGGSVSFDKTYRWQPSNPTLFANSWLNISCDACYAQLKAGMGFSLDGKYLKLKEVSHASCLRSLMALLQWYTVRTLAPPPLFQQLVLVRLSFPAYFALQVDAYVTLEPGARFVLKAVLSASYSWQKTFNLIGPFTLFTVTIPVGFVVIPIPVKLRIDAEVSTAT